MNIRLHRHITKNPLFSSAHLISLWLIHLNEVFQPTEGFINLFIVSIPPWTYINTEIATHIVVQNESQDVKTRVKFKWLFVKDVCAVEQIEEGLTIIIFGYVIFCF